MFPISQAKILSNIKQTYVLLGERKSYTPVTFLLHINSANSEQTHQPHSNSLLFKNANAQEACCLLITDIIGCWQKL